MRKRNRAVALVAGLAAALAVAAPAVIAAEPGETVKVKTTLTIAAAGYKGKVKASNANCVEGRVVILKQKGYGVIDRDVSEDNGSWEIEPEKLKFKGPLPYKVFAEVKPITQGTAGPIFRCLGATSKTVTIAGG